MEFTVITKTRVYKNEQEDIYQEQLLKRNVLGINGTCLCHFFDSAWLDDQTWEMDIDEAIQCLAIKDGVDIVQFANGNYGFVSYYSGEPNGFEIIG